MKYVSPSERMEHQAEYRERLRKRPKNPCPTDVMALLAEMGTGKSFMILDEWQDGVAARDYQNLFVVSGAGSYRNWFEDKSDIQRAEINIHLDPRLRKDMIVAPWVTGGGKKMLEGIRRAVSAPKGQPRALFMNVEALSTVKKAREAAAAFLESGPTLLAVDESTSIKSAGANRTKALVMLGQMAAARRIMTGLVTPKSPMDLFSQFFFLDPRILGHGRHGTSDPVAMMRAAYYSFRSQFAVTRKMESGGRKFQVIVGYKNVDELQRLIAPYSFRKLKEDCLDLEPKTYLTRDVELTDEQKKAYHELRDYATTELASGGHVVVQNVISQMLRLHQIVCGHTMDEDGTVHDIPSNRVQAIIDVLREHSGKAIIWVKYIHEIGKIVAGLEEEFGEGCCAQFHGGNKKERVNEERRFLGDEKCRYMVASEAGAKGNTWNVADLTIFAANSHDLEIRLQSEDRNHRKGQDKRVTYVDLMVRGSVEERIVRAHRKKLDLATLINGDNYREWLI